MDHNQLALQLFEHLPGLRLFSVAAQHRNVSTASDVLCKSSSVITRAIGDMEHALEMPLLDRSRSRFELTNYGRILLERAARIQTEAEETMASIDRGKGASAAAMQQLLFSGRKLQLLMAVTEASNISKAAARLGVSQPALSQSLGRLEEALGLRLFHRDLKGAVPSEAALRLTVHAKRVMAELRHAATELMALSGSEGGLIVVGSLPIARTSLLPSALAVCRKRWARLQVQIVEAPRDMLLAQLRSGEIDVLIAVLAEDFNMDGIVATPLFMDRLGIVASACHPLAAGNCATPEALAKAAWVLPWLDSSSRRLFNRHLAACGIAQPRCDVVTGDYLTIRALLEASDLLAFTSLDLFARELAEGTVVRIGPTSPVQERQVQVLRRASVLLPPPALGLIEVLRGTKLAA